MLMGHNNPSAACTHGILLWLAAAAVVNGELLQHQEDSGKDGMEGTRQEDDPVRGACSHQRAVYDV